VAHRTMGEQWLSVGSHCIMISVYSSSCLRRGAGEYTVVDVP